MRAGPALHAKIFEAYLREFGFDNKEISIESTPKPDTGTEEESSPYPVYLHELGPFPRAFPSVKSNEDFVWRIKQSYGGVHLLPPGPDAIARMALRQEKLVAEAVGRLKTIPSTLSTPTVLVVNDRNVADNRHAKPNLHSVFRTILNTNSAKVAAFLADVPEAVKNLLIIWHVRQPIIRSNPIAELLSANDSLASVTIPIINYHCLREAGVPLRVDMSYESGFRTLLDSLHHRAIRRLLRFPHVIIRFDYGMFHLTTRNGELTGLDVHAFNDGLHRFDAQRHGIIVGTTPLLISALLREIAEYTRDTPGSSLGAFLHESSRITYPTVLSSSRIDRALDAGLLLSGLHFDSGFGRYRARDGLLINHGGTLPVYQHLANRFRDLTEYNTQEATVEADGSADQTHGLKDHRIYYQHAHSTRDRLVRLSASDKILGRGRSVVSRRKSFSRIELLDNTLIASQSSAFDTQKGIPQPGDTFDAFLRRIVECGFDRAVSRNIHLADKLAEPSILCPYVSFGDYISADSQDIDSFLALRNLVEQYVSQDEFERPLAVAVFGPPGSGKSFIVKQVLRSIPFCKFDDELVCNLSQVSSIDHLSRHFHRIQDSAADDAIPVAFFDEFDSSFDGHDIGWLKYFLMPLQDGLYMEGQERFDVKKAIFVFAGGVTDSFHRFRDAFKSHKDQKAPDFISRLRGFMDVQDISLIPKQKGRSGARAESTIAIADGDHAAQLRRAVILRSMLLRRVPQIVDRGSKFAHVESHVIDAFLHVPKFEYGVRSMEAIIEMSRVPQNASSFLRSALPPAAQIEMHVDPEEFLRIMHDDYAQ